MVDNIIYYFSGTGNSLDIARHIAEQIGETMLISMSENPFEIRTRSSKRVGFVFPTYYGGLPRIVENFMKKIHMTEDVYVFAVTTCAKKPGNALMKVDQIFHHSDYHLSYGIAIKSVNSDLLHEEHKQNTAKILANSYVQLKNVVEQILQYKTNVRGMYDPITAIYHNYRMKRALQRVNAFHTSDECNHCGVCHDVCPTGNIEIVDGRPIFKEYCESCMACLQFCPQNAINYKSMTQKKERYHHPAVSVSDFTNRYIRSIK